MNPDLFWRKVRKTEGCWEWTGTFSPNGYGRFSAKFAHRLSWELTNGPIKPGLVIDHLCRNPRCVNPAHLEPVTQKMNCLRGTSPIAKHAAKTECKNGHPFDKENTCMSFDGRSGFFIRRCRTCNRIRMEKVRKETGGAYMKKYHKENRAKRLRFMKERRLRLNILALKETP